MEQIPSSLPVLPIRNAVLFPSVSMPLVVGRPRSLRALSQAELENRLLVVVTQKVVTPGDPSVGDLYSVGTLCRIDDVATTDAGSRQVVVTGIARYRIAEFTLDEVADCLYARGETVSDSANPDAIRTEALLSNLKSIAREIIELLPGTTEPLVRLIEKVDDAAYLSNVCSSYLNLPIHEKQELLEMVDIDQRMERLLETMHKEREVLNLQKEIRDKLSERLSKAQREAILREQLRTIRGELGEEATEETNDEIEDRLRQARLPPDVDKVAQEELKRLKALPSASAEYHVVRTYLEWLASMPWSVTTQDKIDLREARRILDEDHYGLEQIKKRILQFLAVAKLKNDLKGPILCLVGPPGVGKTSLGQSIARTLGRKYIRTSLGGVRDEAEIRGHRRTYVGAMPGRIIQSLKRAGTRNPVMILDEIDKLRADFHGDPSSAMLEVLDPEQNKEFVDHYLDVPFDLSDTFFIATANVLDTIPGPLRDRMEILEVNGYTTQEKLHIARNYLIKRELAANGIRPDQVEVPDESLLRIITHHTREAGVRELQRKIGALFRGVAQDIVETVPTEPLCLGPVALSRHLGAERYFPEQAERVMKPGVATGLAWTPHGGDLLFLEASLMPGKGQLILTGQLGDVMKESAQIALSLVRSSDLTQVDLFQKDIHIHVPAGAIPKDGPSAGVAILASLISLLTQRAIDSKIAMTGEITLRGAVLPVGGIKEKVLAAHRAGLLTLILPRKNEKDLEDVPREVRDALRFHFIESVEEMIEALFFVRLQRIRAVRSPLDPADPKEALRILPAQSTGHGSGPP